MSLKYEPIQVKTLTDEIATGITNVASTPHPTPYTPHPTPHTLLPTPYTLHPHPTPYSLLPTPYSPHPNQPSTLSHQP